MRGVRRLAAVNRLLAGVALLSLVDGCDPGERSPTADSSAAVPTTRADPPEQVVPEQPEPEPEPAPLATDSRPPELDQATSSPRFDANTATAATVRVLTVHRDSSWTACGIVHSTGVIEVEVLELAPAAPRMLLIVSCPVDLGRRELLEVGAILEVDLFARRQRWPTPPAARTLAPELPRRFVESLRRSDEG
jgi:hypothetical protein